MPPKKAEKTFTEVATDYGLKQESIDLLLKDDVCSVKVLAALKVTDLEHFHLSLGQHRLLESWLEKLTIPKKPTPQAANRSDEPPPVFLDGTATTELLAQNDSLGEEVQHYMETSDKMTGLLTTGNQRSTPALQGTGKKPLLIPDFVTCSRSSCDEEEKELATDGQATLLLKTSKATKPKPEDVTTSQWISANARIQAELIRRGDLGTRAQLQYSTYIGHLGDLAQTHTWASVLLYDHAFRKLQATDGLPWDDANESWRLAMFHLERRPSRAAPAQQRKPWQANPGSAGPRLRDNTGHPICLKFNSPAGCNYPACKYSHSCLQPGCQAKHPQYQHSEK